MSGRSDKMGEYDCLYDNYFATNTCISAVVVVVCVCECVISVGSVHVCVCSSAKVGSFGRNFISLVRCPVRVVLL